MIPEAWDPRSDTQGRHAVGATKAEALPASVWLCADSRPPRATRHTSPVARRPAAATRRTRRVDGNDCCPSRGNAIALRGAYCL